MQRRWFLLTRSAYLLARTGAHMLLGYPDVSVGNVLSQHILDRGTLFQQFLAGLVDHLLVEVAELQPLDDRYVAVLAP